MDPVAFFDFQIGVAGAVMVLSSLLLSKTWTDESGKTVFQTLNVGGGLFLFVHALFLGSFAYIILSIVFTFVAIERLNRILFMQSSMQESTPKGSKKKGSKGGKGKNSKASSK